MQLFNSLCIPKCINSRSLAVLRLLGTKEVNARIQWSSFCQRNLFPKARRGPRVDNAKPREMLVLHSIERIIFPGETRITRLACSRSALAWSFTFTGLLYSRFDYALRIQGSLNLICIDWSGWLFDFRMRPLCSLLHAEKDKSECYVEAPETLMYRGYTWE